MSKTTLYGCLYQDPSHRALDVVCVFGSDIGVTDQPDQPEAISDDPLSRAPACLSAPGSRAPGLHGTTPHRATSYSLAYRETWLSVFLRNLGIGAYGGEAQRAWHRAMERDIQQAVYRLFVESRWQHSHSEPSGNDEIDGETRLRAV